MKITVMGTGYVGLTTGTCLANLGHDVICLDIDEKKIEMLKNCEMPIYETGLKELVERNSKEGRLSFTTDSKKAIEAAEVIFIAVGTPSNDKGGVEMKYIKSAAADIGKYLNGYKVIVDKSTVPVGTADMVKEIIEESGGKEFDLCSNPEFLREGRAIKDFMNPDRIVVGIDNGKAKEKMLSIYKSLERTGKPILFTDIKSAEMIKYASNAFLATKISFINEVARLCEKKGADIKLVAEGMGLDTRIGPRFLQSGIGYGGSCFPKDVKGLIATGLDNDVDFKILKAVEEVNKEQRELMLEKIGDVDGKKVAAWGLAFKPNTDDLREAPSITVIEALLKKGAEIVAFDPVARKNAEKILNINFADSPYDALQDADILVIFTEWDEFRNLDLKKVKELMKGNFIVDGRNIYNPQDMKSIGFEYIGFGRG